MGNYNHTQLEELLKSDNSEKDDIRMKIFRYTANFGHEYGQIAEDIRDFFKKTDGNVSYHHIYRKLRKFLETSDEHQNFFGFFYFYLLSSRSALNNLRWRPSLPLVTSVLCL